MPRLPLWLLLAAATIILLGNLVFFRSWDIKLLPHLGGSQHNSGSSTEDMNEIPGELSLSSKFEYRRYCFAAKPNKVSTRTSLANITYPLLSETLPTTAADWRNPDKGIKVHLQPCQTSIPINVPSFKPNARVDTSALFFGVATKLQRVEASLPAFSRWLSNTGSTLLVLLVDQPNLEDKKETIDRINSQAQALGVKLLFAPYHGSLGDTEGLKNFALAEPLWRLKPEAAKWFVIIDDDTFFVSLPKTLEALAPYDPDLPYYIGGLTEGHFRVAKEGFKAWGGAGFFISPPLMRQLAANAKRCQTLDEGFGDILWRDCILEVTSPTVKLTILPGLNQMDLWGDMSGWYEAGQNPLLTVHHWKSWHFHPIPLAHMVADVIGPDTFLQRYKFADDIVLTNGYSIVAYPKGLPDLNLAELTMVEEVGLTKPPSRLEFHNSLGMTRPALKKGTEKISWEFKHAVKTSGDRLRQFYVKKATGDDIDSLIEIDWTLG